MSTGYCTTTASVSRSQSYFRTCLARGTDTATQKAALKAPLRCWRRRRCRMTRHATVEMSLVGRAWDTAEL